MTLARLVESDPVRLAVQATLAAMGSFYAIRALGMDQASWCVISALFTVHVNVGSTLSSAASRIAGAIAGLAIGVACVWLIGTGGTDKALGLALGVAVMSLLSALRPELSYGLVTVAIVLLSEGSDVLDTAVTKAIAIALGTGIGTLVAVVVLPQHAHRSAERHLGQAVTLCRDLLRGSIQSFMGEAEVDLRRVHSRMLAELQAANAKVSWSESGRLLRRRSGHPLAGALLSAVRGLWTSVNLFERLDVKGMPDGSRALVGKPLDALDKALGDYFSRLGEAVAQRGRAPDSRSVHEHADAVMNALREVRRQGATQQLRVHDAEQVFALSLAIEQTLASTEQIASILSRNP
ncbi:hypothetical protein GTW51_21695 [Aurantimonas aggregata]|uniref:FUSC family protein n=1 Tax=Aurantimonas aggregata TaxID=2047720 RepID=A0A6L9MMZ3_9HYPH|nr:FUSC family protein [Aurantimonas aggregata]NDV89279.1 hypothetical protein [Aurantimonas aggregata]